MRTTATTTRATSIAGLPRGWTVLGLALVTWFVVGGAWIGLSQLYGFVASTL